MINFLYLFLVGMLFRSMYRVYNMLGEIYKKVREIDLLITLANSENADIKAKATVKLNNLLKDQEISQAKVHEILSIFIKAVNYADANVKQNSLEGIIILINKYALSENEANEVLEFIITNALDERVSIKNIALVGINLLIEKKLLSAVSVERILEILKLEASSTDADSRKFALFGMSELIGKDMLLKEKVEEIFALLVALAKSTDDIAGEDALLQLIKFIETDKLPTSETELVTNVFIEEAINIDINNRRQNTALFGINKLIEKNKLPTDKIEDILSLLIARAKSANGVIVKNALFGIAILIEKNRLPEENINEVLGVFIEGMKDSITIQNALFGIGKLIEKNKLPEDRVEEVLSLFFSNVKNIDTAIGHNALWGMARLIEKKKLPTSRMEEIVDFLEEQVNEEGSGYIRYNAIIIIKKLVDNNLIPENKIAKILNLFITLKKIGMSFFDSISEAKKEEIASIIDGSIITKIQTIYTPIDFLIAQTKNQNFDIRNDAIDKITTLVQEEMVPAEKIDEVFHLFLAGAQSENELIRINSLFSIKCLVEQNKLCTGKIDLTLNLFTLKALDPEKVIGITALSVIIDLIKQNKLFPGRVKKVLEVLIIKTQDINEDIAKNSIFGINKLIEQGKLPADKVIEILNLFIALNKNESNIIRKEVLIGIGALIKKDMIYAEKISEVIDLLIINIRSVSSDIKEKALFTLNDLLKKDDFFIDRLEEIMGLFVIATEDMSTAIRVNGFFGINQLIKKDPLLGDKIEKILSMFINGVKDADICTRKESLFGIGELIKHDRLPIERIEESLNLFIEGTKDRYPYVQKEGFSGICFLLEKDILPASAIGLTLDLFIEGLKYSDDSLKKEAILGITKLIDKDQLLVLKVKIEEVLGLLQALTNADNCDLVMHNAITAIGKLAEKDIIPEYKIEEILGLLVKKKENSTLLFAGITEAEKAKIASVLDSAINKINTAHPSISALMDQASSFNDAVRVSAISKLIPLIKKDKILTEKIDEVLTILISQIKDECDDARNGALSGINVFIEKNKISAMRIEEIYSLYMTSARHINIDTRKNILFGIAKLIEQNKLPAVEMEKALNIFISRTKDENVEIEKQALFGLLKITEKGKFPVEKLKKIIDIFMAEVRSTNADIKQTALRGLVMLEEQHFLPLEKTEEVLINFIAEANNIKADIKQSALRGLGILAERNKIHIDIVDEVLDIFMIEVNNLREIIKKHSLFGINQLIVNDHVIPKKIHKILDLFITSAQDAKIIIKKNALYGMSKLVEKYQMPLEKAEKILELFMAEISNEQADIKRWAILGINKLIEKKELPTSKTEKILELLIILSRSDNPDIGLSGLFGIGGLIEKYELSDVRADEVIYIFMETANSLDVNTRKNILFCITQLVEKNNFSIEKRIKLLDFFIAIVQEVDADIKNHGLFGITKLIYKDYITEDKVSEILNVIIAASKDNGTKENALFAINALIRMDKLPLEMIQVQVVLDLFVESVRNENINVRKNAIQLVASLIDKNKIQIDFANEIFTVLEKLIESESDAQIKRNLIIVIKKLVEHELIHESKIEKILDIFIAYKKNEDLSFDGMSAVEAEGLASIKDGTIITKMQTICSSISFLIFQAKNPDNESRENIIKKIALLIMLNKIPAEKIDEILSLFIVGIKDININVRKSSFSGINVLLEKDKLSAESMQSLFILFIKEMENKDADIKQSMIKLATLLISRNIITTEKIEEMLILLEDMAKKDECNDVRYAALATIRELANKDAIPNNKIEEILNLFITIKESNALFFDGMSEEKIEEIRIIADEAIITKMQAICASVSFITFKGKSLDSEVRVSAIKQIVLFAQEDKIPKESLDEALMFLIASANDQYDAIKNDALIGIRALIEKNKITTEKISAILDALVIEVKSINTEIRIKSLFIIGDILEKYELSVEKINEVIDVVIAKIRDIEDLAINNALWIIWILAEENKLPLAKVEGIWDALIETQKISDHYIKKNALLVMCKLVNKEKIPIEKTSIILDILKYENQELLGFRKVFYIHHNFLLSEIKEAINKIVTPSKMEIAVYNEETILLEKFAENDLSERKIEDPKTDSNFLSITPAEFDNLRNFSEEIANSVLIRVKLLLKAKELESNDIELEKEFINELAILLRVSHKNLLTSANLSEDLKSNLVKQIAAELKKNSKLYVDDEKFFIQEQLREDSIEFFNPIILMVKDKLKQHQYYDAISGDIIQVYYLKAISYENIFLNMNNMISAAYKIGGTKAVNNLITLGEDLESSLAIIEATKQYDINHVLSILFGANPQDGFDSLSMTLTVTNNHNNPSCNNGFQLSIEAKTAQVTKSAFLLSADWSLRIQNIIKYFYGQTLNQYNIEWQLKKSYYHHEIEQFSRILQNNNIKESVDILRDYSVFKKNILLKLHPDKGGNSQEFVFAQDLQKKISENLDIQNILDEQILYIQPIIYKTGIGFRVFDTITDSIRLIHEPTVENLKKVVINSNYIYSMYAGVNSYSIGLSSIDAIYKTYKGEYIQALKQITISSSYMILPTIIEYLNIPYLGFAYSSTIMIYTGYTSLFNVYSLYQEYGTVPYTLKSLEAHKNMAHLLSHPLLQNLYDFSEASKEYDIQINNIKLELEKTYLKNQLSTTDEFAHKLYEYIYVPLLNEKYSLLNKIIQGVLTEEEANSSKSKHIQMIHYDHCMEVLELKEDTLDHYYCYSVKDQIIDHIIVGDGAGIEIIASL